MTENRAILIGILFVNIPVLTFLVGPLFILLHFNPEPGNLGFIALAGGVVIAWLWWSVTIPKWRLWSYKRVSDINKLKEKAINAGLTWPHGSFFARTEIKSSAHAAKEAEYEKNA